MVWNLIMLMMQTMNQFDFIWITFRFTFSTKHSGKTKAAKILKIKIIKSSTRIGQKFSMEDENRDRDRDRSFDESSNLRRFSSAAPLLTSSSSNNVSTFENRNNVLERHPRKPNFHKSPNLPVGSNSTRNVFRVENSEDDTEDDASSVVSKDSNENFPYCKSNGCQMPQRNW
jgi:hypothetical protein